MNTNIDNQLFKFEVNTLTLENQQNRPASIEYSDHQMEC